MPYINLFHLKYPTLQTDFFILFIGAYFKKTFQHAHVKRFSKTSWARKKINFTPIV